MKTPTLLLFSLAAVGAIVPSLRSAEALTPDLHALVRDGARWVPDAKGRPALFTSKIIWLDGVSFGTGTIEVDILGKSAPRQSNFPGIVFHGVDDRTHDCVYFRPFNFRSDNPENASHAVQYVSLPAWPWQKLRAEKTGQYEKPIVPAPDGDAWLHARIVVDEKKVRVFVNGASQPSLEVALLNDRAGGKIGITGGDAGDGGHFANLKITPAGK